MTDKCGTLRRLFLSVCAAGAMLLPCAAQAQPGGTAPDVSWSVHDRFRLFSEADDDDKAAVHALMARMAAAPFTPLSAHHDEIVRTLSGEAAAPLRRSNYRPPVRPGAGSGYYPESYLYGGSHRVLVRFGRGETAGAHCRWSAGTHSAEGPCDRDVVLTVGAAGPTGFGWGVNVELEVSVDGGPKQSKGRIQFRDTLIVALGDSYISGEGNPDVPSVISRDPEPVFRRADWGRRLRPRHYQRAEWWDEPCHRSLLSWPVLSTLAYSAGRAQEAVTLVHLGCSGATVSNIIARGEKELPGGGDEPNGRTQLAQLLELLNARPLGARRVPDRILLSVGGNDSGFVGVIKTLLLPPSGYAIPILGPMAVGGFGEAVCPYRFTGMPLSRLCRSRPSAEARLAALPDNYDALAGALRQPGWGPVYQFAYPNPALGEGGVPCDVVASREPVSVYEGGGFEALMGILHRPIHGRHFSWDFRLQHHPELSLAGGREIVPGSGCDDAAEPFDSEVCQGLWVHNRLNTVIRNQKRKGWTAIESHLAETAGRGLCRRDERFPLGLPRVIGREWQSGWTPRSFEPYDRQNPRWFRTANDSIVTQYGGPKRFQHGSVHPTLMAHLAYADAALKDALHQPALVAAPGLP
ncbi:MAG TPA: hypothetical protein VEZ20_17280 [Allosphingosinicella sp.]|jgi:hypothetical protein|nr:hypothetical protein [Allosphingosinicella sp.]